MPQFVYKPSSQIDQDLDRTGLDAVLKTAPDAAVIMRLDGTIAGWNDAAERIFGWSYREASGQLMSDLIIPPQHREAHTRGLKKYLLTGEAEVIDRIVELTALRRNGEEFPIELKVTRTDQFSCPVFLGFIRDNTERQAQIVRQQLMIGELNHRVKNLLAVVGGVAHQTIRSSESLEEFNRAFMGRLESLGHAHEILTNAVWQSASLSTLMKSLLGSYTQGSLARIRVVGPDIKLPPKKILSLSMLLHELLTNAIKHGALMTENGNIDITWMVEDNFLSLTWKEHCYHLVTPPTRKGFGSKMIELASKHELHGVGGKTWHPYGMEFTIKFATGGDKNAE